MRIEGLQAWSDIVLVGFDQVKKTHIPEVIAIKIWKTDRSGYRSPMVADTEGNHS